MQNQSIYLDPARSPEERAQDLLKELSLEEKLAQLNCIFPLGDEYGDAKTFKINQGFKLAGGNGSVIAVKPRAFLVDDGSGCRLLKMEDEPVNALIEKTGELVHDIAGV